MEELKDSNIHSLNEKVDTLNSRVIKQKSASKSLNEELSNKDNRIKELIKNKNNNQNKKLELKI